jgi:hypothetical protein
LHIDNFNKLKRISALFLIIVIVLTLNGCFSAQNSTAPEYPDIYAGTGPIFTNPVTKLAELSNPGYTKMLYDEALWLCPALKTTVNQVDMGYWSLNPPNRTNLINLINSINGSPLYNNLINQAVWDEGVSTSVQDQYPAYIIMNREYWYERAYPVNGYVIINGQKYIDPFPVTPSQADDIWGAYSQRYADMAIYFYTLTGRPANCWCFVNGAFANRIFYKYELPELKELESKGYVNVYFAKFNNSNWQNPNDWWIGTQNAPTPKSISNDKVTNIYDR